MNETEDSGDSTDEGSDATGGQDASDAGTKHKSQIAKDTSELEVDLVLKVS